MDSQRSMDTENVRDISQSPLHVAPITVALLNDYPLVVQGLRAMLAPYSHRVEVVELRTKSTDVSRPVDLALYDTFGRGTLGLHRAAEVACDEHVPNTVLYTWSTDPELRRRALDLGLRGVISKTVGGEALVRALETLHAGETLIEPPLDSPSDDIAPDGQASRWPGSEVGLTQREAEMLALITQGFTNAEIARAVFLSPNSVKSYIRSAYRKIGVVRRSQAVAWGMRHGMAPGVPTTTPRPSRSRVQAWPLTSQPS